MRPEAIYGCHSFRNIDKYTSAFSEFCHILLTSNTLRTVTERGRHGYALFRHHQLMQEMNLTQKLL